MPSSRFAARIVLVVALALVRVAAADTIQTLIDQLNDDSDRVRLSAATNLIKLGDQRAILPLAKALVNDGDKQVRATAAVGLGKLVTSSTKPTIKKLVIANLKQAIANDASDFVKDQATKALESITGGRATTTTGNNTTTTSGGGGGIYVNIGPMSSKTGSNDKRFQALMVTTATKTMARSASKMATSWPGGGDPSKQALAAKNVAGFYVDGTLNTLTVKTTGSGSTVSCKISMLLAEYPSKSVFGFLNGGASVQAGSAQKDIDLAGEDCVNAVVESLIATKIVPTICTKVTCP